MGGSGENKTSANVLASEVQSLASSYQLAWSQGLAVRDWLVSRNSNLQEYRSGLPCPSLKQGLSVYNEPSKQKKEGRRSFRVERTACAKVKKEICGQRWVWLEGWAGEAAETRPQQDLIKHAEGEERGEGRHRGGVEGIKTIMYKIRNYLCPLRDNSLLRPGQVSFCVLCNNFFCIWGRPISRCQGVLFVSQWLEVQCRSCILAPLCLSWVNFEKISIFFVTQFLYLKMVWFQSYEE